MNDLAQMIGLSPDGDWDDEMELATKAVRKAIGQDRPDLP